MTDYKRQSSKKPRKKWRVFQWVATLAAILGISVTVAPPREQVRQPPVATQQADEDVYSPNNPSHTAVQVSTSSEDDHTVPPTANPPQPSRPVVVTNLYLIAEADNRGEIRPIEVNIHVDTNNTPTDVKDTSKVDLDQCLKDLDTLMGFVGAVFTTATTYANWQFKKSETAKKNLSSVSDNSELEITPKELREPGVPGLLILKYHGKTYVAKKTTLVQLKSEKENAYQHHLTRYRRISIFIDEYGNYYTSEEINTGRN